MEEKNNTKNVLKRLYKQINQRRKKQLLLLVFGMIGSSLSEIFSIGAVIPLLAILSAPNQIFDNPSVKLFAKHLEISEPPELLLILAVIFCVAALIAGIARLLLLWGSTRLSFAIGSDISRDLYSRTLHQTYAEHCLNNSGEIIDGIINKSSGVIHSIIMPVITLVAASIMIGFVISIIMVLNPEVAIGTLIVFGAIYGCILFATRKQLLKDGQRITKESELVIKSLQEGLGGIRDVLLDGTQPIYVKKYKEADLILRQAQGRSMFISASPRFVVEALGMIILCIIAYKFGQTEDALTATIPILGALAMTAQRLLPVLQQAYAAWSNIQTGKATLIATLKILELPNKENIKKENQEVIKFEKSIELKNINFKYQSQTPEIIKGISLKIYKGDRIGIIGQTGSGKSTLVDIMMGLLEPNSGFITVDDVKLTEKNIKSWQKNIAHVPQQIYLADSSIIENIAFGIPKNEIDITEVKRAAEKSELHESIIKWPEKYNTVVGERGIRLSGGQRQRIGIARALYKKSQIIILDEATSSLDVNTEQEIMEDIYEYDTNITIIIIAHRISTLKKCNKIIEIKNGKIEKISS